MVHHERVQLGESLDLNCRSGLPLGIGKFGFEGFSPSLMTKHCVGFSGKRQEGWIVSPRHVWCLWCPPLLGTSPFLCTVLSVSAVVPTPLQGTGVGVGMDGWAGRQQTALAGLRREQGLGSGEELLEGHSKVFVLVLVLVGGRKMIKAETTEGMRQALRLPAQTDACQDSAGVLCSDDFRVLLA